MKDRKGKKFRVLADEEKQAGIHKEYLEQVKCCHDTGLQRNNDEEWLHSLEQ